MYSKFLGDVAPTCWYLIVVRRVHEETYILNVGLGLLFWQLPEVDDTPQSLSGDHEIMFGLTYVKTVKTTMPDIFRKWRFN